MKLFSKENNLKTLRETTIDCLTLRLVRTDKAFAGVVIKGGALMAREDGDDADGTWRRLNDAAARLRCSSAIPAHARASCTFSPTASPGPTMSRWSGATSLQQRRPSTRLLPLERVGSAAGLAEGALVAFKKTNLLSPYEQMDVTDLLRGPDADAFVRLCAEFTRGDRKQALQSLKSLLKPHGCAKWTLVTYLPFLWRPDAHFFLKPQMIKDFAGRVGHRFAWVYEAELDVEVYEALLDLAAETRLRIADLQPRDMIDIQSFMWTVMKYKDEDGVTPA
jgi:hypothetical protein